MTTFQSPYQFGSLPEHKKQTYSSSLDGNGRVFSDPSASSSSSSSQEDLLPDLWLEPVRLNPQTLQHQQMALVPLQGLYMYQNGTWQEPPRSQNPLLAQVTQTSMMRDASLEYAQLLLPHSLLAPLTEENLDLNAQQRSLRLQYSATDELLNFEQQQAKASAVPAPRSKKLNSTCSVVSDHHQHHHHKLRNASVSSTNSALPKQQKNINTQLYKTELCVSYMKMGVCPYGNKCQFAHGEHDLKTVERPANWRLKPCANWAKFGSCRYGKRCCFKHGD